MYHDNLAFFVLFNTQDNRTHLTLNKKHNSLLRNHAEVTGFSPYTM